MNHKPMQHFWLRSVLPIAGMFSFRMLGLFMLIPVFTVYAVDLNAATPTLIGVALGSYGLSQGILQIPFGLLSDRIGRKPIITLGLLLFLAGSLWGALTDSIYGMIIARTLQGTGAIGSVLIALLADLTPDTQRTKAMAVIGSSIGLSFSLAMVLSPTIAHAYGLSGIFYFTAVLATLGLLLLHTVVPTPIKEPFHSNTEARPRLFKSVAANHHLQRLNAGIFCQHFILTSTFFVIPVLLQEQIKRGHLIQQWRFYLPLMVFSFIAMVPFIVIAEKTSRIKTVFLSSVFVTSLSQLFLAFTYQYWLGICALMFSYFVVFNILEASLPSLISKQADPKAKGTAMGIYSSFQFLGIFAGGATAGFLYQYAHSKGIFILNASMSLLWLIIAMKMTPNAYQTTISVPYDASIQTREQLSPILENLPGVMSVAFSESAGVIYLRIDKARYKTGSAEQRLLHI